MPTFTLQTRGKVQQRILTNCCLWPSRPLKPRSGLVNRCTIPFPFSDKNRNIQPDQGSGGLGRGHLTGVDSRTDFFSVEVRGLTNAQQIVQEGDQFTFLQKTLVLNFFRPGDFRNELEDIIRFGVPAVDRVGRARS